MEEPGRHAAAHAGQAGRFTDEETIAARLAPGPARAMVALGVGCILFGGVFFAVKHSGHDVVAAITSQGPCSASTCTVHVGYDASDRQVTAVMYGVPRTDIYGPPSHRLLNVTYQDGYETSPTTNDMPDGIWIGFGAAGLAFLGLGIWWRRWQKGYARTLATAAAGGPPAGAATTDAPPPVPPDQPGPASPARLAEHDPRWVAMFTSVGVPALPALMVMQNGHTPPPVTISLWVLGTAAGAWAAARGWRIALLAEPDHLIVRNHFRTYRLSWDDIAEFRDGRMSGGQAGVMWALRIRLTDGRTVTSQATGRVRAARPSTAEAIVAIARQHGIAESLTGHPAPPAPRNDLVKPGQAATGALPAPTGHPGQGAASRARRAGSVVAAWLVVTAVAVAVMVALYARDLSKPHADFTLAVWALIASGNGLIATYRAWQRFKRLRRIHQASDAAAGSAGTGDSPASPRGEPGECAGGAGGRFPVCGGGIREATATAAGTAGRVPGGAHTAAGRSDTGHGPEVTVSGIPAPAWAAGTPLPSEVTGGFPLPADVRGAEPSPRRRRIIPLTVAGVSIVAAVAAAVTVLGSSSAHKPAATPSKAARTSTPGRAPAAQELAIGQLRAGDCLQGPPDINTTTWWPDVVTAVPCTQKHLAEVYFSANYWPWSRAFPGNATIVHQAKTECRKAFQAYDGAPLQASEYSFRYISPWGRADCGSGDRLLVCTAYVWDSQWPRGVPLYASIKGTYS